MNMKWQTGGVKYALEGSRYNTEEGVNYRPLVNMFEMKDDPDAPYDDDDDVWALKSWRGPVLLLHGTGGTADTWFNDDAVGPYERLPWILSDLGYFVLTCDSSSNIDAEKPDWNRSFIDQAD